MLTRLLILILFIYSKAAFTQQANIDSLLNVLMKSPQNAIAKIKIAEVYMNSKVDSAIVLMNEIRKSKDQPDTVYGKVYTILGNCYKNQNKLDSAQALYDLATSFYTKSNFLYGQANVLYNSSFIRTQKGLFEEGIQLLQKAEDILIKTTHEKKNTLLSQIYSMLSENYKNIGLFDKAMEYYFKSDKIASSSNDLIQQAIIYDGIARTQTQMGDFANAILHYQKALEYSKKGNFQAGMVRIPLNIASTYFQYSLYDSSRRNMLLDSAELAVKELDLVYKKYNILTKPGVYYMLSGQIAQYRKEYVKSISLYDSSIAISRQRNMGSDLAKAIASKGDAYEKYGDIPNAIKYYTEAVDIFKLNKAKNDLKQAYYHLAKLYYNQGEYMLAAKYYDLYYPLLNEILDEEKIKATKQFSAKFELSKKETKIIQQNAELKEKEQSYALIQQQFELSKQRSEIEAQKQKVALLQKEKTIADKEAEIFRQARETEIREKEQSYQAMLKEATITQQNIAIKSQKQRNLWLILGSIVLGIVAFTLSILYRTIRKKESDYCRSKGRNPSFPRQ